MRIFTLRPDAANIANPESGVDFCPWGTGKNLLPAEKERERESVKLLLSFSACFLLICPIVPTHVLFKPPTKLSAFDLL